MIPLTDVIPSRTRPWVTFLLIALITTVFAYEWLLPEDTFAPFVIAHGLVPAYANWAAVTISMLVHENLVHVIGNVLALWLFGANVEDRLGHLRYLLLYVLSGYAASGAEIWAAPDSAIPLVGASGAVAGVIGAYVRLFPRSRLLVLVPVDLVEVPALAFIAGWFMLQVVGGLGRLAPLSAGGFTFWAPFAGCLAGLVLASLLRRRDRMNVDWWSHLAL